MAHTGKLLVRTRADAVADVVRERIMSGEYEGGRQLRQDALAAEFGVSRIPVREALLYLESEGLVRIDRYRGASVISISSKDVRDLFDFRLAVEPKLLALSSPKLTETDFHQLHSVLCAYTCELRDANVPEWGRLNTEFHNTLYVRANRPRMQEAATQLLVLSDRYTRMQLSISGDLLRAEDEHERLVKLCAMGEFDEAVMLLTTHITNVGDVLLRIIQ